MQINIELSEAEAAEAFVETQKTWENKFGSTDILCRFDEQLSLYHDDTLRCTAKWDHIGAIKCIDSKYSWEWGWVNIPCRDTEIKIKKLIGEFPESYKRIFSHNRCEYTNQMIEVIVQSLLAKAAPYDYVFNSGGMLLGLYEVTWM